jgi:hypothetical protein
VSRLPAEILSASAMAATTSPAASFAGKVPLATLATGAGSEEGAVASAMVLGCSRLIGWKAKVPGFQAQYCEIECTQPRRQLLRRCDDGQNDSQIEVSSNTDQD